MVKYISTHTGKEIDDAIDGVATNAANIQTNADNITALETKVNTNADNINTHTEQITLLQNKTYNIQASDGEGAEAGSYDTWNGRAVKDGAGNNIVDTYYTKADLSTLETKVNTNTDNIAAITTKANQIVQNTDGSYSFEGQALTAITAVGASSDGNGANIASTYLTIVSAEETYLKQSDYKTTTISSTDTRVTITPTTTENTTDYAISLNLPTQIISLIQAGDKSVGLTMDTSSTGITRSLTYTIAVNVDSDYLAVDSDKGITLTDSVKTALSSSAGATSSVSSANAAINVTSTVSGTNTDYSINLKTSDYLKIDTDTDVLTLSDDTVTKLNNSAAVISVYSNTSSNYQLKITNGDGTEIITPNLMGKSSGASTGAKSVIYQAENYSSYADTVYVYNANRAAQNLATPESLAGTVTSGESVVTDEHAIDINQTDFGWANAAYIINTNASTVTENMMALITANINGTATEYIYFIPATLITGTTAAEKATAISTLLTAETMDSSIISITNNMIHTGGNKMTVAIDISSIAAGDYYIALSAHSDNSKPIFYDIWIQE